MDFDKNSQKDLHYKEVSFYKRKYDLKGHWRSHNVQNFSFLLHYFGLKSNFIKTFYGWKSKVRVRYVTNNIWPQRSHKVSFLFENRDSAKFFLAH